MTWLNKLEDEQYLLVKFWIPALVNGLLVWLLLIFAGDTPIVRASGLALVIVGVTLALRRMGSVLSVIGGLSLALSPVFWSQTGGGQGEPATIVIAIVAALVTVGIATLASKRPSIGFGLGVLIFAGFFWSQIGTPRSIRLTGFVVGWLMYLVIDMLLVTNPRPDEAPMILQDGGLKEVEGAIPARPYHTYGILLLMGVGIINDPLLSLLLPAIFVSLLLTHTRLRWWYWLIFGIITVIGLQGIWQDYLIEQAHYLDFELWRHGASWVAMIRLMMNQFTIAGVLLSIPGLARLARWYPHTGTVSMIGFAAYWIFGTVYTGPTQTILLLPLYIIFVLWMSYAVLALSEWVARSFERNPRIGRYGIIALYGVLPLFMLSRILSA